MTTKAELLNRAAREYNAFEAAVHGLNLDQMSMVWLGTWSIRDIVAHIAGWHRAMAPALDRIARGERPWPEGQSYDDFDAWNARFVASQHDHPGDELLLELDRTHELFMRAAAAVPDERVLEGKTAYRIIDSATSAHYKEHADQILAWRQAQDL